jgi:hypothetical protein
MEKKNYPFYKINKETVRELGLGQNEKQVPTMGVYYHIHTRWFL